MNDHWLDGLPFEWGGNVTGGEDYWFEGLPSSGITVGAGTTHELYGDSCPILITEGDIFKSKELYGDCIIPFLTEARIGLQYSLKGEAVFLPSPEGGATKVIPLRGEAILKMLPEGRSNVDFTFRGEAFPIFALGGKAQLKLHPVSAPHLTMDSLPYLGAGVKFTYDVGTPFGASFWVIMGMDEEGYEDDPHGSLKWTVVRANADGLAVNYYFAPTDEASVGKIDRVLAIGRLV